MSRRLVATLALAVVVTAALAASCSGGGDEGGDTASGGGGASGDRPNLLFIVADDMNVADLASMPTLAGWLGDEGTSFTNAYVSVSLCCPSRVTMLRGQYAHNTGVLSNDGVTGGFPVAHDLGLEDSTVATWLGAEGYRTGLIGKYLNFYPQGAGVTYVPPGWDEWVSPVDGDVGAGYDYTLNENGRLVHYGDEAEDYVGSVLVDHAADFVTRAAEADEPFFTFLAMEAPHEPSGAAPEDVDAFVDEQAPRTASFDQADVSDLPAWVRDLPLLTDDQLDEIDDRYQRRKASLRSLDRDLARLADVLDANGQLDDTYVVFTSDNGFHLGQHRLKAGKQSAYDEDVNVPLLVRGPGVPAGETSDAIVANPDLAPTFAALAGAETPAFVDGRSLTALWQDPGGDEYQRAAVLLEHWTVELPEAPSSADPSTDASSSDAAAAGSPPGGSSSGDVVVGPLNESRGEGPTPPEFQGVRTERYTYVEYVTGEVELYDDLADPDQLLNLADTAPRALLADLSALLADLGDCAGDACRAAEDRVVP